MPPDPASLAVVVTGDDAALTWDASPTSGVADYEVHRRTPSTGAVFDPAITATRIASGVTGLAYADNDLAVGSYDWQVFGRITAAAGPPVAGYFGWWTADDPASITASAGAVSAWADKSGAGRHLTQATGTNQPQTGVHTINAKNVLTFDGTNDWMTNASFPLTSVSATVFIVLTLDTNGSYVGISLPAGANDYDDTTEWIALFNNGSLFRSYAGGGFRADIAVTAGSPTQLTMQRDGVTPVFKIWKNGTVGTDGAGLSGAQTVDRFVLGAQWVSGAPTSFMPMKVVEIITYPSALGTTDRQSVELYLKTKWSTP